MFVIAVFEAGYSIGVPIRYAGSNVGFVISHANTVVERFLIPLVPAKKIALVT